MAIVFNNGESTWGCKVAIAALPMPFTLACWFYAFDDSVDSVLLDVVGAGSDAYRLRAAGALAGNPVQAAMESSGESSAGTSTGFSANTWHHACARFAATDSRSVLIDGGGLGSDATSKSAISPEWIRLPGSEYGGFRGRIAWPALWSRALSDAEVVSLASGYSPLCVARESLLAWWPLGGFWPVDESGLVFADHGSGEYDLAADGGVGEYADDPPVLVSPTMAFVYPSHSHYPLAAPRKRRNVAVRRPGEAEGPCAIADSPLASRVRERSHGAALRRHAHPQAIFTPHRTIRAATTKKRSVANRARVQADRFDYRAKRYFDARGLHRVFNAAGYRFYRSALGPPAETDAPFATSESMPFTPPDAFADDVWYLSVSYFNGVLDSGFLPIGPGGETYLRMEISGGVQLTDRPLPPLDWRIEQLAGGVVRIHAMYLEDGPGRANQWSIAYTTDGSNPPDDAPTATIDIAESGMDVLSHDIPAQSDSTVVRVAVQVRRNDGTDESPEWRYSDPQSPQSLIVSTTGASEPLSGESWLGSLPAER